jgi:hypothetical protein
MGAVNVPKGRLRAPKAQCTHDGYPILVTETPTGYYARCLCPPLAPVALGARPPSVYVPAQFRDNPGSGRNSCLSR